MQESASVANVLDRMKGYRPTFTYSVPCDYNLSERPVSLPQSDAPTAVIFHHSRLLLRLLLAKPSLLSFNIANNEPTNILFDSFDCTVQDSLSLSGSDYLTQLFTTKSNNLPLFVEIFQRWHNIFYPYRRLINWVRLYEDGSIRLQSAATMSINDTCNLNNDRLSRMYEKFSIEVRRLVLRFGNSILCSVASTGGNRSVLFFDSLLKSELDANDVRLICLLLYDLVDILENICLESRTFYSDSKFLQTQFAQARRLLVFQRIFVFRRLIERHAGFSEMRDWLYFRDNFITAAEVR